MGKVKVYHLRSFTKKDAAENLKRYGRSLMISRLFKKAVRYEKTGL